MGVPSYAASVDTVESAINDTAAYLLKTVTAPEVGSIGGEWCVLGLARSGYQVPDKYYKDYYARVEKYVADCKGVLHRKKYTEHSRLIVALSTLGKDARDVAGYDLTKALGDYDKTIWQGLNGPIWALIALDSRDYPMPQNPEAKTQATRQMYIDRILACQLPDGGWSLFGGTKAAKSDQDKISDPDITGMAIQALAKYQDQPAVAKATQEALACMSKRQDKLGGFDSWGTTNSESVVQMICALGELGLSLDDPRFVKNGNTMMDNLLTFHIKGEGFLHTHDNQGNNLMSTEQGFYGLISAYRVAKGMNTLYRMSDAKVVDLTGGAKVTATAGMGLEDKDPAVKNSPIKNENVTFSDVKGHANENAIIDLAKRNVINGMGNGTFAPDKSMTRAEFATIVVKSLGLATAGTNKFSDVPSSKWFAPYIGAALNYGIVTGVSDNKFNPNGTISRQEAALMVSRAAKLCGMKGDFDMQASRDVLAPFGDYVKVASWAMQGTAFCYYNNILDQEDIDIRPKDAIKRCEIAQMIYNMLNNAKLL